jgi:hypothetical protein
MQQIIYITVPKGKKHAAIKQKKSEKQEGKV